MTDSGAERAARAELKEQDARFDPLFVPDEVRIPTLQRFRTAIIREETGTQRELFGRAMVIIKGLTLGTRWEIAPPIKRAMEKLCADFESLPAAPDEGGTR